MYTIIFFFRIPLNKLTNATFVASKLVFISPAMLLEGANLLQSGVKEITCLNTVPGLFVPLPMNLYKFYIPVRVNGQNFNCAQLETIKVPDSKTNWELQVGEITLRHQHLR